MAKMSTNMRQAFYGMGRGDVIAFGGRCITSRGIQLFTTSEVSHVGMVYAGAAEDNPYIIESTSLGAGRAGVKVRSLEKAVLDYPGRVWWLPLCDQADMQMNWEAWEQWTEAQVGKAYDFKQVLLGVPLSRIPLIGKWLVGQDDFRQVFCSELVAGSFEAGGLLPFSTDASHTTPEEVCEFRLYKSAVQLRGKPKNISNFSTRQIFHPELDNLPGQPV